MPSPYDHLPSPDNRPELGQNSGERIALFMLYERRIERRWRIFFRTVWLALFIFTAIMLFSNKTADGRHSSSGDHTALIRLEGEISTENTSATSLIDSLNTAFDDPNTRAIIIQANSPGGSPVLSGRIYDEIRRLRALHTETPVYVVIEDMCASGCYYIAAAADRIFVDKASIVGSIGVVSGGFGFVNALEKLGIERRVQTAGESKALGDPFAPIKAEERAWKQQLLDQIHQQFIHAVKTGRGQRLKSDPQLFSGLVWLGEHSIKIGLTDGLGSVESTARDLVKQDNIVDFTANDPLLDRFTKRLGVSIAQQLSTPFSLQLR